MNILYLTNRHADGLFVRRLKNIFESIDPSIEITATPAYSKQQALADAADVVISEVPDPNLDFMNGILMPFNELQIPKQWSTHQRQKFQFYVTTTFSSRTQMQSKALNVSATLSSPLCWLPPLPPDQRQHQVVLYYPMLAGWTHDDIAKFVRYTVSALSRDTSSLKGYHIIAECDPFEYDPRYGETISFVDDDGLFFWDMLSTKILVSMSHDRMMEMVFIKDAIANFELPIIQRSESLIHPGFKAETMLDKFSQPRSYADIKRELVTQDWFYRGASEQNHFIDIGSGIGNISVDGRISFNVNEYNILQREASSQVDWAESLMRMQARQRESMADKMGKAIRRLAA